MPEDFLTNDEDGGGAATAAATEPTLVAASNLIWEKCWKKKVCIDIPFDGSVCSPEVRACIRLTIESSKFFLEIELLGGRSKYELIDACYQIDRGSASVKICITDVDIQGGRIRGLSVRVDLCVRWNGFTKCWKLYEGRIKFRALNPSGTTFQALGLDAAQGDVYGYVELDTEENAA